MSLARQVINESWPKVRLNDCPELRELIQRKRSGPYNPNDNWIWIKVDPKPGVKSNWLYAGQEGQWLYVSEDEKRWLYRLAASQALSQ
jgi:hypothetical protein